MTHVLLGVLLLFPQLIDSTKTLNEPVPPATEISHEKRGDIFVARKMYREAIESYEAALPEQDSAARLHNKIGIAHHRLHQLGQARRHYEEAARIDKNFAEAINNLGTVYYAQKRFKRAQRTYEKALKAMPNSASFHSNLGTAYFARRRYRQATEQYLKALELDPKIFESGGRVGTALQDRSVEERGKYYYHVAQAFAENGQYERAILHLRRAIEEGYSRARRADEDSAFRPLYEMPEFLALMNRDQTAALR